MSITEKNDAKKVFRKLGTCSRTFTYLLNREFGNTDELHERAADPLAGGIFQNGYQCGMLWGSSLAVGAEAYRTYPEIEMAIPITVLATQNIMKSYSESEDTFLCKDVTQCDFKNKWSFAKYMISGRFLYCFKLAEKWAPKAIEAAKKGLNHDQSSVVFSSSNCASETARRLGASKEQMVMVAGFAGGLGLSGSACGALSAAIWMRTIKWCTENPKKTSMSNPYAKATIEEFDQATDGRILCADLANRSFNTFEDHIEYMKEGGCANLITALTPA
ncbi:MAG: C-GCAxxG-C-C family protein [Vicingaceae bacterium]